MSDLIRREDAMGAVQDHFNADGFRGYDDGQKMMDRITGIPSAETHEIRTETHGVCSDLISRADIEYHTQLEARGNGQYEEVEVAYKSDIDNLPSAATDMSEYSDKLWIAAYDRGKAAMSQYVLDILDLMLDEDMVARIREWIWSERDGENATTTESKLKNPCDSLLTADPDERKEHKSKLDLIDRMDAIAVLRNIELGNIPCTIGKDIIHGLPPVTPAERTGKWVFRTDTPIGGGAESAGYVCSECGRDVYHRTEYCPGCGAKMGGDTE